MSSLLDIPLLVTSAGARMQLLSLLDALEDIGIGCTVDGKCAFLRVVSGEKGIRMTDKKDIFPPCIKKLKFSFGSFKKNNIILIVP